VILPRAIGLAGPASLCVLGIAWWCLHNRDPGAALAHSTAAVPIKTVHRSGPGKPLPDADSMVESILARPLFSPERRPASLERIVVAPKLPRLSGIVTMSEFRRAIFETPGAGRSRVSVVSEADTIGGWTVLRIGPNKVVLTHQGTTLLLTPAFRSSTVQPAPPPPRQYSLWERPADSGVLRARWSNPQLQP
jgi:hypothetical protein